MKWGGQGRYVTISTVGETDRAFVPSPLPPHPAIEWTTALHSKFDQALLSLGRLSSISTLLPDTSLLLYMYIRKEAALERGLHLLEEGFPFSLRVFKEIHGILLNKGRGSNQTPGEFRRIRNWVGGTRPGNAVFVPLHQT